ncbi:restriction endonuclease S subunit [Aciduliprofundum sp. MAR08-339]|uniref:restriction endonuclease subunit S n=1 Tax=Aciduliprofundum sp. (strain MAR08-339) TaxID=673860 RepID=UPI0002A4B276|nr:restriction endonuclease S subunit [Aciduliprofundum sp. MAR08-339]
MKTAKLDDYIKSPKPWEVKGVEWREVRLGDICKNIESGGTPKRSVKEYWNGDIEWVRSEVCQNQYVYPTMVKERITEAGLLNSNAKIFPKDTILIALVGATLGKVGYLTFPAATNQNIAGIYNCDSVLPKYLFYSLISSTFLKSYGRKLFKMLNLKKVRKISIYLPFRNGKPDLETQKKIVEYIEANFSRIDKILEKKKKELEQLDELWESVLEQAFKPKEGEEWREVRLGDKTIAEIIMGQSPPSNSYNKKGKGVLFLQGNKEFRELYPKPIIYTTDPKKLCKKNDVLISVRAPVGDVNIADGEYCIGRGLAAIRFNGESKYLFYLLINMKERIEDLGRRGTTFKAITKNHLKNLKIPLPFHNNQPDLEKQKEIANYLDSVYEKIKALKEKIHNQISQLKEMKESILEEVFGH